MKHEFNKKPHQKQMYEPFGKISCEDVLQQVGPNI